VIAILAISPFRLSKVVVPGSQANAVFVGRASACLDLILPDVKKSRQA
jgi:hypothetical protein